MFRSGVQPQTGGGGTFFTLSDPRIHRSKTKARSKLALVNEWGNTMTKVASGWVSAKDISSYGLALGQVGPDGTVYSGGATDVTVTNARSKVSITSIQNLSFKEQ